MPLVAPNPIQNSNRRARVITGRTSGDSESAPGDAQMVDVPPISAAATEGDTLPDALMRPDSALEIPENDDPERRRIVNGWYKRGLLGAILRRLKPRPLTPQEVEERAEMAARKAVEDAMRADADTAARRIINQLNALNLCYRYPKSQRDMMLGDLTGIQEVRFDDVLMMPDAIYLRVHAPAPRGVSFLSLSEPQTLTNLSLSVGKQVMCKYSEEIGFWYIIPRSGSIMGIPGFVEYKTQFEKLSETADKLTIPMGITLNSRRVYKSLAVMPHMLVAGATGTGKSNFGNIILATLIQRNTPDDLRMVLVDLKGGMEMSFYEGLPHLLPLSAEDDKGQENWITDSGIVDDRKQVPDVLDWLITEAERRMTLLKQAGYKDLGKFNSRRKKGSKKLPRILLFIDEWADVKLAPGIGAKAEDKLANLAARSRAVGIHVVLCTQSPKREVIGTLIKTNLPGKIAFSMPSNTASILVLDNGDAKGLAPAGRMIYQQGNEQITIQTPYMPDETLRRIVADSIQRAGAASNVQLDGRSVTADEIMAYALEYLDGALNQKKIFTKFQSKISWHDLVAWMQTWDDQEFEINGEMYHVKKDDAIINSPRKLIPSLDNTE